MKRLIKGNSANLDIQADPKENKPSRRSVKVLVVLILALSVVILSIYLVWRGYLQPTEEIVWVNQAQVPTEYEVIVVGAEPEGIAAAVAAARNGMTTLLLEKSSALGGLMTLGKLNYLDMCNGRDGTLLTRGIFQEFYKGVNGNAFDITVAKNYFLQLVTDEPLITLRTEAQLLKPLMDGSTIIGVEVKEKDKVVVYSAKRIIDATTDGDLAAMAGAPFTYGGADIGEPGRKMGVTLVFELSGVRWLKVGSYLNTRRFIAFLTNSPAGMGANNRVAWGYEQEGLSYNPSDQQMRLRGLNVARQRKGSVLINALLVFGVDPLDEASYNNGIDRAIDELAYLTPYIRENYTGFEKAELSSTASRLYVRESRHFIGEYQLSIDDVLENRDQWDKIAIGGYPADVQPSEDQPYGTVIGSPDRYAIPFRCLVPLEVENLLIVGRSASFTSLAASSARVIPLGMVCGQAAGTAAAQSIMDGQSFRHMTADIQAIERLQATLSAQGAYLEDFSINEPITEHWAYDGMASLRRIGLMAGGYENDYGLDTVIDKWFYQFVLNGILDKISPAHEYIQVDYDPTCLQIIQSAVEALAVIEPQTETRIALNNDYQQMLRLLTDAGVLTTSLEQYFIIPDVAPQTAEVVMLLANLYNYGANPDN